MQLSMQHWSFVFFLCTALSFLNGSRPQTLSNIWRRGPWIYSQTRAPWGFYLCTRKKSSVLYVLFLSARAEVSQLGLVKPLLQSENLSQELKMLSQEVIWESLDWKMNVSIHPSETAPTSTPWHSTRLLLYKTTSYFSTRPFSWECISFTFNFTGLWHVRHRKTSIPAAGPSKLNICPFPLTPPMFCSHNCTHS